MRNPTILERFKPGAEKSTLLAVGGTFWIVAGLVLLVRGSLLVVSDPTDVALSFATGAVGAIPFYGGVFRGVSRKYASRIRALLPLRPCVFSFLNLRGYVMMGFMIGLGIWIRTSGLLPAHWVGALYVSIGIGLTGASPTFFRSIRHT
jgi:hypothetical protein